MNKAYCPKCGGVYWGGDQKDRPCSCEQGAYQVGYTVTVVDQNLMPTLKKLVSQRDEARAWARKLYARVQELTEMCDEIYGKLKGEKRNIELVQDLWMNFAKGRDEIVKQQAAYIARLEAAVMGGIMWHTAECQYWLESTCTCGASDNHKLRDELRARGK